VAVAEVVVVFAVDLDHFGLGVVVDAGYVVVVFVFDAEFDGFEGCFFDAGGEFVEVVLVGGFYVVVYEGLPFCHFGAVLAEFGVFVGGEGVGEGWGDEVVVYEFADFGELVPAFVEGVGSGYLLFGLEPAEGPVAVSCVWFGHYSNIPGVWYYSSSFKLGTVG